MGYIAVIGAGSWGTTLACLLAEKEYDVTSGPLKGIWLKQFITPVSTIYICLMLNWPANLKVTDDLEKAVKNPLCPQCSAHQFTRSGV